VRRIFEVLQAESVLSGTVWVIASEGSLVLNGLRSSKWRNTVIVQIPLEAAQANVEK
jgi:hypothetical protein